MTPFEAQAYLMGNIKKTETVKLPLSKCIGYYTAEPAVSQNGNIVLEKGEKIDSRKYLLVLSSGIKEIYVHRKPRVFVDIDDGDMRQLIMLILIEEGISIVASNPDVIITSRKPQGAKYIVSKIEQEPATNLSFFSLGGGRFGFFLDGGVSDLIVASYIYILPAIRSLFGSSSPYQRKMYLQSANSYYRALGGKSVFLPARLTDDSLVEILSDDEENYLLCDALIHITSDMFGIDEEQEIYVYLI